MKLSIEEQAKTEFLEDLKKDDPLLEQSGSGGGCQWWNISCKLGDNGAICSISHECQPSCNFGS